MKRIAAFFLAGILLCLCACSAPGTPQQTTESSTQPEAVTSAAAADADAEPLVFRLESLPDIGTRKQGAVKGRFFPEYRDTFEPRDDYGSIVPYIGSVFYYTSNPYPGEDEEDSYNAYTQPQYRYGLMTGDGRIVVDDVYAEVYFEEDAGPAGAYCMTLFADRGVKSLHPEDADTEEEYEWLWEHTPDEADTLLVSADGTWSIRVPYDKWYIFGETLFAVYPSGMYENKPEDNKIMVYDYHGRLQYELSGDPGNMGKPADSINVRWLTGDVLMAEYWWSAEEGRGTGKCFFRDKSGKPVLETLEEAGNCTAFGAYVIVEHAEDRYSLVDLNGRERFTSTYMHTQYLNGEDILVMEQNGEYRILDTDLRQMCEPKSFKPYLKALNGELVYGDVQYYGEGSNWYLETDKPADMTTDSEDYIDGRYVGCRSGEDDIILRDKKTGRDLVTVPYADIPKLFANGELAFFYGLYGKKTHQDYVYSIKEEKMLLEADTIACYEAGGSTYMVFCDGGNSAVLNYTTGEKIYQKVVE